MKGRRLFALLLSLMLILSLGAGGALAAEDYDPAEGAPLWALEGYEPEEDYAWDEDYEPQEGAPLWDVEEIVVSDVDGLLAALGSDRVILLAPGVYDLSQAADYGTFDFEGNPCCWWEEVYDGYELVLADVSGLTLMALEGPGTVELQTPASYANVLCLRNVRSLTLSGLTMGHAAAPGECSGGVLYLQDTDAVNIQDCDLYGCGTLGVRAEYCRNLWITGTTIRECSDGAVDLTGCYDVRLVECQLRDCGWSSYFYPSFSLVRCDSCGGVAILDSSITGSCASSILAAFGSREVYMYDTLVAENSCPQDWGGVMLFNVSGQPVIVDGCSFADYDLCWAGASCAVLRDGPFLSEDDIADMERSFVFYEGPQAVPLDWQYEDGMGFVSVSTVDELLAALYPYSVIYLSPGEYDLTQAMNYGSYGGAYYYWQEEYDGYSLHISGADNLHLVGDTAATTLICTEPRYTDVLTFEHGTDLSLVDVTLGHNLEPGTCAGGVLRLWDIDGFSAAGCGFFGCGTLGVDATDCRRLTVLDCEIYQCSYGAATLFGCDSVLFYGNDIHDCAWPTYELSLCRNVEIEGEPVEEQPLENEYGTVWGSDVIGEIYAGGFGIDYVSIDLPEAGPYVSYWDAWPDAVG